MRWEDEVEDEVEQYSYFKISFVMMLLYSNPLNRKKWPCFSIRIPNPPPHKIFEKSRPRIFLLKTPRNCPKYFFSLILIGCMKSDEIISDFVMIAV